MNAPTPVDLGRHTNDPKWVAEHNARHMWHPMIDPKASTANPPMVIDRADGVYVYDTEGRRYLDCIASLWNVNVGHNRPEVKAAIVEQLDRLAYYQTFAGVSNPLAIALSTLLTDMLAPEDMSQVFFSSGGSDAVETAFKLARQYWKLEGQPERTKIFSLKDAYHGVHFGGASANGNPRFRRAYEPLLPGFFQVENPNAYRNPWNESDPARLARLCAELLDREIQYQGADTVAAFIAEPVQGAGGMIVPPAEYWPLVREVCDRHGVLLIADEVVTGFGRTGSLFGSRGWGVKPDIMALAKGINSGYVPLGATVVNTRVASAWQKESAQAAIMHGYTYSGHPLACAAALACQKIVIEEDLPGNSATVGAYFLERINALRERHEVIGDTRGRGLMLTIECVKDRQSKTPFGPADSFGPRLSRTANDLGALVRWSNSRIILSPPLVFTREHVDEAVGILDQAFSTTPV
ncbi:MAG: aminotransferase class III-fold pyridoxal phosphate-dependent enzyme [Burkholderiaceae bacterium]|nr:aminotransferase class III-fold pyridoxal phosphate-dependent enzyme [Burkholderiaceae bacterium]